MKITEEQQQPKTIYLKDYQVPEFLVDTVELHFNLQEDGAEVKSKLKLRRNPRSSQPDAPLSLDGQDLSLRGLRINGRALTEGEYTVSPTKLVIAKVPAEFELECTTWIEPQKNTSLEGLYKSSGMFCTQCEAEGFRKITYYFDRPDVMAVFTTTITADKKSYPILLANGNRIARSDLGGGRHSATWQDPFRKPCYLFALVAGDLGVVEDFFTTRSGRKVTLQIFVNKGNEDRCAHAMESLKKSMKWDEDRWGLEYDLDIFMIVAVDDFNFGAMENKGLNIFNASLVLAKPSTATDMDYEAIEAVVGHEYFHNWTGNRVTCRDWFQISLKEGLTVYRDQEFTSDMLSRGVKRIDDVNMLRTHQFAEDAGPMAHPIRPQSYMEINNFYTLTVYEKGAEVIRMIATILGREKFRKGIDRYFELFDGQAVTTDDFVRAMMEASGEDLTQFRDSWYNQAGTPELKVRSEYNASEKKLLLHVEQSCAPSPGQPEKRPYHIPFAVALIDRASGAILQEKLLHVKQPKETFTFTGVAADPVLSLLRDFSAPVKLNVEQSDADLQLLLRSEKDAFARWEAAQLLATRTLNRMIAAEQRGESCTPPADLLETFRALLKQSMDPALLARLLTLPSEQYLAQLQETVDPVAIAKACENLERAIAAAARAELLTVYRSLENTKRAYRYGAQDCGERALKRVCLLYLASLDGPEERALAAAQFRAAGSMTDEIAAFGALSHTEDAIRETVSREFYAKWSKDSLVMNKWLAARARSRAPGALARVKQLMQDPVFSASNPNKLRAVLSSFAHYNPHFHALDGEAYRFFTDQIIEIDGRNPSVAARLVSIFNPWKRLEPQRRALQKQELERILAHKGLSTAVFEIASKALK